ncbi:MAG: zinc-binding alcohol dehydrogenase [Gammaproteobacteria bacterium]|nr:zinc-binding alcohol dehydrogenase [Gammaproteobacteria bacterium]
MSVVRQLACVAPGWPPRLEVRSAALPAPRRREVLVELEAASVNPIDAKRATGYGRRLLGLKRAAKFPLVLGNDIVGVVRGIGPGATRWRAGDRVVGVLPTGPQGAHASHVLAHEDNLRAAPDAYPATGLATLPYTFTTLWLALRGVGLTSEDARGLDVLIGGASGGLGRLAIQLLTAWGARVTAICSKQGVAACRELGATDVLDRTARPVSSLPARFDASLNFGSWTQEMEIIGRLKAGARGHATTVHPLLGSLDERGWIRGALHARAEWSRMRDAVAARGSSVRHAWTVFRPDAEALDALLDALRSPGLQLPIGLTVDFQDGRLAFEHVAGQRPGRAVLLPARSA